MKKLLRRMLGLSIPTLEENDPSLVMENQTQNQYQMESCSQQGMAPNEKRLIQNLQTEDLYQHQQMRRDKFAREAGLNPNDYKLPFPSSSSTTTVNGNPILTTALALMAGGGVMAAIPSVLSFFEKSEIETKTIIEKVLEEVEVTTKIIPP